MPNTQVNPSIAQALGSAFGGQPQQQPQVQPSPTAPEDPGVLSSIFQALIGSKNQAEAAPSPQQTPKDFSHIGNVPIGGADKVR